MPRTLLADTNIEVGHHITGHLFGLTFNVDTIYCTLIAGAVVIGLGLAVRANVSADKPGKLQLAWEAIVTQVTREVEASLGKTNTYVIQLAIALFTFILTCNLIELIPSGEHPKLLPAPTSDVNLTFALALFVIVGVHVYSFRQRGVRGYFHHYIEPNPALLPLTIIEELVKPVTLALRLFGNIFAGGIMLAIIGLIPFWGTWAPNILWKLFDMFIGLIQAFIFALLTVIYFGMAGETHGDEHGDEHDVVHGTSTTVADEASPSQRELSGVH